MRKKLVTALSIVMLCIMTACGTYVPTGDNNMTEVPESSENEQDKNMTEVSQNEEPEIDENMTTVSQNGSVIKEDDGKVYLFGKNCIYTVDKMSNQTRILWKNDSYEPNYYLFNGCGVLLGEKLYFLEEVTREDSDGAYTATVLSMINTDGSGYEQAVSESEERYGFNNNIYYSDGILYVYRGKAARCYKISADGTIDEEIPSEETAFQYVQDLEEYDLVNYDGRFGENFSPVESIEKYGCLIMTKDSSFVKIDVESGSEEWLECSQPVYMLDDRVLFIGTESGSQRLEGLDINTGERKVLGEIEGTGISCTAYGNDTFYYMISDNEQGVSIGYISIAEGTGGVLLTLVDTSDYVSNFSPTSFGIQVSENALYYMDMKNYDAYLMRVSLDNLQQEQLGEPVYSTGINRAGRLEKINDKIYSEENPDITLATTAFSWIVVDDAFAGAEKINAYLSEEMSNCRTSFENTVKEDAEFLAENGMQYSYDSSIKNVKYFDGSYLSFIQEDYEYLGGAHGLPLWEGYVFDLTTGERLLLPDIIENSEEELKDIVTQYFSEKIDKEPEGYWEYAKDVVYEMFTLESTDFVLTDEGMCFYVHPYNIAPYAAGLPEVTIPYSEFKLKNPGLNN